MSDSSAPGKSKGKELASVRITQQFRERNNMTYELDCSGVTLALRIFFPLDADADAKWRIEAQTGEPMPGLAATATASSRTEAFRTIARDWHLRLPNPASDLDWSAIERAMAAVRAI